MSTEPRIGKLRLSAMAVSVAALLALSACGGGGGGTVTPLTPATGLTPSAATPQTAASASDTLAARLPTASNQFAPLTSVLKRDFNQPQSAAIGDNAHIKAISSDGANGFRVTYVIGDDERTVHFEAGDYGAGTSSFDYYKEVDGRRYWLWSYTGAFSGPQKNMGSREFQYFDASGTGEQNVDGINTRNYMTYGVRTDAAALPSGSGHYSGRMYADIYGSDSPSSSTRTRVWGSIRLTVDFAEGSVEGDMRRFQVQEPGQPSRVTLPLTVYANIADGRIVDGQFTATWTEVNPLVAAGEAFSGDMLGEFYGPGAEEVGGVLNGTNDDEVIAGWFGGMRPTPSVPAGDLTALSAASHQDLVNSATAASDGAVTAIASDGAGGFNLTYSIGSDTHEVNLGADVLAANPAFRSAYVHTVGSQSFVLFDQSRSFTGNPEFSHFNVNGWSVANLDSADAATDFYRGFVVYGAATDAAAMPSGTATYAGRMYADRQPADRPGRNNRGYLRGGLTLSADFDQGTVGGSVDNLQYRPEGGSWRAAQAQSWTIGNGAIAGNALTADVTAAGVFDGDMEGRFFGPDAAEVGGTIQGTGLSDNAVVYGYFGGKKQ